MPPPSSGGVLPKSCQPTSHCDQVDIGIFEGLLYKCELRALNARGLWCIASPKWTIFVGINFYIIQVAPILRREVDNGGNSTKFRHE